MLIASGVGVFFSFTDVGEEAFSIAVLPIALSSDDSDGDGELSMIHVTETTVNARRASPNPIHLLRP